VGRDTIATWSRAVWLAEATDSGGYLYIHRHWNGPAKAYVYSTPGGTWAKCTMCSALLNVPVRRLGRRMSARVSARRQPLSPSAGRMQEDSHQPAAGSTIRPSRAAQADPQTTRAMARVTVGPKKGGGWHVSGGGETHDAPTQREGIKVGRQALDLLGGGELIVKGRNGQIRMQNIYGPPDQPRSRG
jgi:Uncharacterized protein conserved in bacteria (DUF2188)